MTARDPFQRVPAAMGLVVTLLVLQNPAAAVVHHAELAIEFYGDLCQYDVPGIGSYACGPTAATNGLCYLQNAHGAYYGATLVPAQDQDLDGDSDVDAYDDLIATALVLADPDYFDTVHTHCSLPDNFIWGTGAYIEACLPGFTRHRAESQWDWIHHPPMPEWVVQRAPTWEFLYRKLVDGADLQILLSFPGYPDGFGHWVTANGFHWDDANENGVIERAESAWLGFMDSLTGREDSVDIWHLGDRIVTDYPLGTGIWISAAVAATPVPECPGDLDGDDLIHLADLAQLLGHYGTLDGAAYVHGDLDDDGDVDLSDLSAMLAVYGTTCD